jgi:excisionase family DNA binding protein
MDSDNLLTTEQAAQILCVSTKTLTDWRTRKRYPLAYVKIGSRVLYKESDVQAFIESRTVRLDGVA